MPPDRRPILVTGSHRSGSSWVGQMISLSPRVGYIHEPFALHHHRGVCAMEVPYWFLDVTPDNAAAYRPYLQETLRFRYRPLAELRGARKLRHLGRIPIEGAHFLKYRMERGRPLLKDPLALFSAEWLASEFDMAVALLVRHPAAFAASLRQQGYRHPFSHFLSQPSLMERLSPFEEEIRAMDATPHDDIEEAALLWRITTSEVRRLHTSHPEWSFNRYEDIVNDPAERYGKLFEYLRLPLPTNIRDRIVASTDPNVDGWKRRLSGQETRLLRARVEDQAHGLYPSEDW